MWAGGRYGRRPRGGVVAPPPQHPDTPLPIIALPGCRGPLRSRGGGVVCRRAGPFKARADRPASTCFSTLGANNCLTCVPCVTCSVLHAAAAWHAFIAPWALAPASLAALRHRPSIRLNHPRLQQAPSACWWSTLYRTAQACPLCPLRARGAHHARGACSGIPLALCRCWFMRFADGGWELAAVK
jgi:hypothetical protein